MAAAQTQLPAGGAGGLLPDSATSSPPDSFPSSPDRPTAAAKKSTPSSSTSNNDGLPKRKRGGLDLLCGWARGTSQQQDNAAESPVSPVDPDSNPFLEASLKNAANKSVSSPTLFSPTVGFSSGVGPPSSVPGGAFVGSDALPPSAPRIPMRTQSLLGRQDSEGMLPFISTAPAVPSGVVPQPKRSDSLATEISVASSTTSSGSLRSTVKVAELVGKLKFAMKMKDKKTLKRQSSSNTNSNAGSASSSVVGSLAGTADPTPASTEPASPERTAPSSPERFPDPTSTDLGRSTTEDSDLWKTLPRKPPTLPRKPDHPIDEEGQDELGLMKTLPRRPSSQSPSSLPSLPSPPSPPSSSVLPISATEEFDFSTIPPNTGLGLRIATEPAFLEDSLQTLAAVSSVDQAASNSSSPVTFSADSDDKFGPPPPVSLSAPAIGAANVVSQLPSVLPPATRIKPLLRRFQTTDDGDPTSPGSAFSAPEISVMTVSIISPTGESILSDEEQDIIERRSFIARMLATESSVSLGDGEHSPGSPMSDIAGGSSALQRSASVSHSRSSSFAGMPGGFHQQQQDKGARPLTRAVSASSRASGKGHRKNLSTSMTDFFRGQSFTEDALLEPEQEEDELLFGRSTGERRDGTLRRRASRNSSRSNLASPRPDSIQGANGTAMDGVGSKINLHLGAGDDAVFSLAGYRDQLDPTEDPSA